MRKSGLKLWICLSCLATSMAAPAPMGPLQLDIIDLAAISRMTPQQLEVLAEGLAAQEIMRTKRSSAQALTAVASKASSGIASKGVGLLGQASAGAFSAIASASSKSGHDDEHHGYSYEPQESKVDFWGLKKSILYTLFQAVKAITGGVTILKGQLIKGGGALASSFGKVIAVKGDAVSNLGKKIVSSAALSNKKPHSPAVYGPPPAHHEYPPSAYGAPTAPAHYSHTAPSAPSGFAAHKYTSHLDDPPAESLNQIVPLFFPSLGRSKLNGVHAGLVILTPLNEQTTDAYHEPAGHSSGHTPLEPPPSIIHSAFSAIKNAFSSVIPSSDYSAHDLVDHPPPPPVPSFKPMSWDAVNSYGEPATVDSYSDYSPHQHYQHPPISNDHYASSKLSAPPTMSHGLTAEKLQKISHNLDKLAHLNLARSSEELPRFDGLDAYRKLLMQGVKIPLMPTPVVTDAEIGVLPAALLPSEPPSSTTTTTSTTSTTTTARPPADDKTRRRKDVKYLLRGNKIVIV